MAKAVKDPTYSDLYLPPVGWSIVRDDDYNILAWIEPGGTTWDLKTCSTSKGQVGTVATTTKVGKTFVVPQVDVTGGFGAGATIFLLASGAALLWLLVKGK
jgi:hypothetical protein